MGLDRRLAHDQLGRDLRVREPAGDELEHLELAETIAALPQPAIRTDLEAAERGWGNIEQGLQIEAACFMRSIFDPATREGLDRFAAGVR